MQRISSTSPHKIQPHQKDTLNHKQKLLAKRAAAKVVRRKINESQSMSKVSISTITNTHNETQNKGITSQNVMKVNTGTVPTTGIQIQSSSSSHSQATSHHQSRFTSHTTSPSQSLLPTTQQIQHPLSTATTAHSLPTAEHIQTNPKSSSSASTTQIKRSKPQTQLQTKAKQMAQQEEEKHIPPTQASKNAQQPLHTYDIDPLDQNIDSKINNIQISQKKGQGLNNLPACHKPSSSLGGSSLGPPQPGKSLESKPNYNDGEKRLNKKQQMRLPERGSKQQQNLTRSMIEDGSEDFTNIEERMNEDTKISCRNAVVSSLNNVSVLLKGMFQSNNFGNPQHMLDQNQMVALNQQLAQINVRHRRGTTQSQLDQGLSNQQSKEETFETSSFFDERSSSNRVYQHAANMNFSPHKCNQVEEYNIPTIFNTLMFGIDQNRVDPHVRESFSSLSQRRQEQINAAQNQVKAQPNLQGQTQVNQNQVKKTQKQLSNQFAQNRINPKKTTQKVEKKEAAKLNQFVTKVEKSNIMVFDSLQQQNQQNSQTTRNSDNESVQAQKQRKSQLSLIHQHNVQIEQNLDHPDTINTEENNREFENPQRIPSNLSEENQEEEEQEEVNPALQQIEDIQSSELHRNHLIQTLQSLQYIKTLPPVAQSELKSRKVVLPPYKNSLIKKTIIFDLDETLVHCIDDIENNPCDQVINVTFPNGETVQAGINIRPYAIECLKKANENYQVVVFTASHRAYADVVLDQLDPDRSLIQFRMYREHCIRTEEGIYIKDLRIIQNRNLKDLIIVDNAVYSFGYQLDNGIPIIPFYDDKSDEELMHLIYYFNCLATCPDVREQNRKAFQLKDLQEIDIAEYLQSMMNNKQQQ